LMADMALWIAGKKRNQMRTISPHRALDFER